MENLVSSLEIKQQPLQYPSLREQLLDTLRCLSDYEYQQHNWVKGNSSSGLVEGLDIAVHFLYDDTVLAEDPDSAIGVFLYDRSEVTAITQVINALDRVFEQLGLERTDREYINSDLWPEVLEMSAEAYFLLKHQVNVS